MYEGQFGSWEDVQREFCMNEDEPDQVLLAIYERENYEGQALVAYRRGDKFYYSEGSHCSCYGLEGQWAPEEYDRDTFTGAMERASKYKYGLLGTNSSFILKTLSPSGGMADAPASNTGD